MKNIVVALLFFTQFSFALEVNTLEEAKKIALGTNKIIVIDFWATWCGPCKKMDADTWYSEDVKVMLENFIFVKIDIDTNREIASKYNVASIPNVFFVDGNGAPIYSFLGYKGPRETIRELEKFAISTEYLSSELINYYKTPCYNYGVRLVSKYYDYSLYAGDNIKSDILNVCDFYLNEAKGMIKKEEESYKQKKQKIELLKLYDLAYRFKFEKLEKKISEINQDDIEEYNQNDYWFLKYLVLKGLKKENLLVVEEDIKKLGLEVVINKADKVVAIYENSIKK